MKRKYEVAKRGTSLNMESFDSNAYFPGDLLPPNFPVEWLKMLQTFKVPMQKLRSIANPESKIDFMIDHMQNHIKDQLRGLS